VRPGRVPSAASLPGVTNASRAKRKRAAVRSAKRSRQNSWWYGLTAIVIIAGIAGIVYTQATKAAPVGPFLADPNNPTKKDTHWHAALGVYLCDHWMGDSATPGVWNWPASNSTGSPSRAKNPNVYAGLHSHDDGVIHMEPATSEDAGKNTTIGRYFDYGGWKLSSTGFTFLGKTVKNGDKCGTAPGGTLQWETGKWDGTTDKQKYTVQSGNPASYKTSDDEIVVIAFLPAGKSISSIGDPPSVPNLAKALGAENVKPGSTVPTTSAAPTTAPGTGSTKPPTVPPTPATTATSKP
jgi:hypothetical protein